MASESKSDAPATPASSPVLTGERNPRGIPAIRFLEDIDAFAKSAGLATEVLFEELQTMHSKYKMMEAQLLSARTSLKNKLPNIKSSLDAVVMLKEKQTASEDVKTYYNLSDQVFVPAVIPPQDRVCIWLGAGVMLEYSLEEAERLLRDNFALAETKMAYNAEDLAYLRDQVITTEVNIARVYNYDVKKRKEAAVAAAAAAAGSS